MVRRFQEACKEFLKDSMKDVQLLDTEKLLWIYLNIYYIYIPQRTTNISRSSFLKQLNDSIYFEGYTNLFSDISQEIYDKLNDFAFLDEYAYGDIKHIDLKELESLYEGLLMEKHRSNTGTYYTPQSIVSIMVYKTLEAIVEDTDIGDAVIKDTAIKDIILAKQLTIEKQYGKILLEKLLSIRVIDIACGGGVFLRELLKLLTKIIKNLYDFLNIEIEVWQIKRKLLEESIFGIDIQGNTVALCKLLFLIELKQENNYIEDEIKLNIVKADGLQLRNINGGAINNSFDIVIGNPPYIGERGNKEIFDNIKKTNFGHRFYEGKMDYFYYFIYKAYELLKPKGFMMFITTNYFVTADGAAKLRCFFKEHMSFKWIVNFNEVNLFKEAKGQHNLIFLAEKFPNKNRRIEIISLNNKKLKMDIIEKVLLDEVNEAGISRTLLVEQGQIYNYNGNMLINREMLTDKIFEKIQKAANYSLGELCNINQGIVSGADRLNSKWGEKLQIQEDISTGIFVLKNEEIHRKGLDSPMYKPLLKDFYKNSNIRKYSIVKPNDLKILYINDNNVENIEEYPHVFQHLLRFKGQLIERREVKNKVRKWYSLQWPRQVHIFEGEKIVSPQRAKENTFAYHKGSFYASADVYFISKNNNVSLMYLLGILNSSLMYFWLFHRGKRKGEQLELYATPLKAIPIVYSESSFKLETERFVEKICNNNFDDSLLEDYLKIIDENIFSLYQLNDEERETIRKFVRDRRKTND
ncbi:Eco57I restriction-modification methylase domain-containing protein [Alkaliphilus peptidifermentans]|uniref:site-specific DNA-methyltransferase (adenine-specific) n=1 Tax=Alkaliphilus peptidifermentans DSM 18978 TaxID=1120976 RepID=A0A1G5BZ37_9FIRM|nr:N-6 DNA methylase [Alkaliphilus peptidifermentans]SCX95465.1 adenine-specific DNA-methyltransferase [Alkaliphilus peptidifermentans DSM 18978]